MTSRVLFPTEILRDSDERTDTVRPRREQLRDAPDGHGEGVRRGAARGVRGDVGAEAEPHERRDGVQIGTRRRRRDHRR